MQLSRQQEYIMCDMLGHKGLAENCFTKREMVSVNVLIKKGMIITNEYGLCLTSEGMDAILDTEGSV